MTHSDAASGAEAQSRWPGSAASRPAASGRERQQHRGRDERISKGRTLREFVSSVLLVPSAVTFVWLSVLGGSAAHMEQYGAGGLAVPVQSDPAVALHALLEQLPWATVTMTVATLPVVVFFVTSSDSGSLVDDMVTSGGHPNPPKAQRVFGALSEGAVAASLLVAGQGGLQGLQTAALLSGLPMTAFLVLAAYGLIRALRVDHTTRGVPEPDALHGGRSGGVR